MADLLRHLSSWMLAAAPGEAPDTGARVARYAPALARIRDLMPAILPARYRQDYERQLAGLRAEQVPEPFARRLTAYRVLAGALDIADLATQAGVPLEQATAVYFELGERLRMPWLLSAIVQLKIPGHWQALARGQLREDAYRLHRRLAAQALDCGGVDAWTQANAARLKSGLTRLAELQAAGAQDHAALSVAVRELYELLQAGAAERIA